MTVDLGEIAWNKRQEIAKAEAEFHERISAITCEFKDSWIKLTTPGGSTCSYPLFGDATSRNAVIDKFAADLKVLVATGYFPR